MLELIYPSVCGICGKINKKHLCKSCQILLKKYEINHIYNCTQDKEKYFDYQIKIYKYEGIIRSKIIDYKFNEKAYLFRTFEKMIINNKKIYSFLKNYDIILYVPMFKKKKNARGYNQAKLVATELGKTLKIKVEANNLVKIKDTKKQSTLSKIERSQNIKNAFTLKRKENIINKKIILFDDIYTTGNTVNECSKILKQAGAEQIAVITIAVD